MKKTLLGLAAAVTLGFVALTPATASANGIALDFFIGTPAYGAPVYQRQHVRPAPRYHERRQQVRRNGRNKVCTVDRVREWTRYGWEVSSVRTCRPVRSNGYGYGYGWRH